jgi:transmembrane sensor
MTPSANSDEVEAAAARWFAKRESGAWELADEAKLQSWLDVATAHRIAFLRIASAWERSGRLTALGAGVPKGAIPSPDSWSFSNSSGIAPLGLDGSRSRGEPRRSGLRMGRISAVAALLLIGATLGVFWYVKTPGTRAYSTTTGALSTVPLADGSKITLNTDSLVHVALAPAIRRVTLDQGEAFFDVSKDAARPFVVEAADKRVTAVGTQFSVRREHDDIHVLVAEGRVTIQPNVRDPTAVGTVLTEGTEAWSSRANVRIDRVSQVQIEQLLSWRTGHLIFHDTTLADAVADFNRYSARKITIADPSIAGIRIGGDFRAGDIDAFLWLLEDGFPIRVERLSERVVLRRRT